MSNEFSPTDKHISVSIYLDADVNRYGGTWDVLLTDKLKEDGMKESDIKDMIASPLGDITNNIYFFLRNHYEDREKP